MTAQTFDPNDDAKHLLARVIDAMPARAAWAVAAVIASAVPASFGAGLLIQRVPLTEEQNQRLISIERGVETLSERGARSDELQAKTATALDRISETLNRTVQIIERVERRQLGGGIDP